MDTTTMALVYARLAALDQRVLAMAREHMALAAGVEGRLAAIEARLASVEKRTEIVSMGPAVDHAGITATPTPRGARAGLGSVADLSGLRVSGVRIHQAIDAAGNAQHLADMIHKDLKHSTGSASHGLIAALDRYADEHDGLCAICGEYHNHHLSTCWKRLFNAPAA